MYYSIVYSRLLCLLVSTRGLRQLFPMKRLLCTYQLYFQRAWAVLLFFLFTSYSFYVWETGSHFVYDRSCEERSYSLTVRRERTLSPLSASGHCFIAYLFSDWLNYFDEFVSCLLHFEYKMSSSPSPQASCIEASVPSWWRYWKMIGPYGC